jgi:hypothetical protein
MLYRENARFLLAILVEEKTSFFVTAPFSYHTPRSDFIAECQAMRDIVAVIRSTDWRFFNELKKAVKG